jgi:hypothetical protein
MWVWWWWRRNNDTIGMGMMNDNKKKKKERRRRWMEELRNSIITLICSFINGNVKRLVNHDGAKVCVEI